MRSSEVPKAAIPRAVTLRIMVKALLTVKKRSKNRPLPRIIAIQTNPNPIRFVGSHARSGRVPIASTLLISDFSVFIYSPTKNAKSVFRCLNLIAVSPDFDLLRKNFLFRLEMRSGETARLDL